MQRFTIALVLSALAIVPAGCNQKSKGTESPDAAADSKQDPLEQLKGIPNAIQAEIDQVLQPINDVDVVVEQVTTMPDRLNLDASALRSMASASLKDGSVSVSVDLDVTAEARAEIEQLLTTVRGIATGLRETPKRVTTAATNIVGLGTKATALAASLTAKYQAKLSAPFLKADAKAKIQADLADITKIADEIKAQVGDAKETVTSLPDKGIEALAKLTAAFTAG